MLDLTSRNEVTTAIRLGRERLEQIARITPKSMSHVDEYLTLWKAVVENERRLNEVDGKERAYAITVDGIQWDQRTKEVVIIDHMRDSGNAYIAFEHARSPVDPMNKISIATFTQVVCIRRTHTRVETLLEYPLGIVGLDGLGAFVIYDSILAKQGPEPTSFPRQHYCFVFTEGCVECIAASCAMRTLGRSDAHMALKELIHLSP